MREVVGLWPRTQRCILGRAGLADRRGQLALRPVLEGVPCVEYAGLSFIAYGVYSRPASEGAFCQGRFVLSVYAAKQETLLNSNDFRALSQS